MNTSELLTNEEMSALLPDNPKGEAGGETKRRILPYNFRRPDRLSKDQVRSLYLLHDLFANTLSSSLPLFLRTTSETTLISVEQQSYGEYQKSLPDPSSIYTISIAPLRGIAALEINSAIAFPIIDRMLGGTGQESKEQRAATEIEQKILEGFVTLITDNWREAWRPIIELEMEIVGRETRPQLLQIVAPNEVVVTMVFQVNIGETRGSISLCLPVNMLEPVIEKFRRSSYSVNQATTSEQTNSLLKALSQVRFAVSAELEKERATVSDLMSLSIGDVLRTNYRIDHPINIAVDGSTKFTGRLAAREGRVVAHINQISIEAEPVETLKPEEQTLTALVAAT